MTRTLLGRDLRLAPPEEAVPLYVGNLLSGLNAEHPSPQRAERVGGGA